MSTNLKLIENPNYNPMIKNSTEDLWLANNKSLTLIVIEGYNPKIQHFDYAKQKYDRELFKLNMDVNAGKAHYPPPVVKRDKDDKPIVPQKKNFIDVEIARANSYFSQEKQEKFAELKSFQPLPKKELKKPFLYTRDRITDLADLYKSKENENKLNEFQQERSEKVKEKQTDMNKTPKKWIDIIQEKYKGGRSSLSNNKRVGDIHECIYRGEKSPFWKNYVKPGDEETKDTKKFYPNINYVKERYPKFKYYKPLVLSTEHSERRQELITEMKDKVKSKWEGLKMEFNSNNLENFIKLKDKGKGYFKIKNVRC
jgi:hypothetical protein